MASDSPRITELRRRVDSDPSSIAFAQLAEEYRRAGQFDAAEQCCRTGLARHPSYLSARVTLGRTLIELNKLDEAELELAQVLKAAPDNLAAIRGLAEIHQRVGRLDAALDYYRRALTLARHDPELEEIVAKLNRELAPPAPAPPVAEGPTDFDKLLDSLGITGRAAPPAVEALLNESQPSLDGPRSDDSSQSLVDGPQFSVDDPRSSGDEQASALGHASVEPQPDWMVGPLPTITAAVEATESAPAGTSSIAKEIAEELAAAFENRRESGGAAFARQEPEASFGETSSADARQEPEASFGETSSADARQEPEASFGGTSSAAADQQPPEAEPHLDETSTAFARGQSPESEGSEPNLYEASTNFAHEVMPESEESQPHFDETAADFAREESAQREESIAGFAAISAALAQEDVVAGDFTADAWDALVAPLAPDHGSDPDTSLPPEHLTAPVAPVAPVAPEYRTAPVAPDARDAPVAPDTHDAPVALDEVTARDRRILTELEAWLAAIKR